MSISAAEQYGIELLNRARLNPVAEAQRYHVPLNHGVHGDDRISTRQKQALAPDQVLDESASKHSSWMLSADTFSHSGAGGSTEQQRMKMAGYQFSNGISWSYGENLAYVDAAGRSLETLIETQHRMLMQSDAHRPNILRDSFREIGYAQVMGDFRGSRGSMLTQDFAHRSTDIFVTGVAYNDKNGNNFYNMGEGQKGIRFSEVGGGSVSTASAGGYGLQVEAGRSVVISIGPDGSYGTVELDLRNEIPNQIQSYQNMKLDLVNRSTIFVSGNATLLDGLKNARLLGINDSDLTGNELANILTGNIGNNILKGNDGNDELKGGVGRDELIGGTGADGLFGGNGNDSLNGQADDDQLTGGAGADQFEFARQSGVDTITDFSARDGDQLLLSAKLWGGQDLSTEEVVRMFATADGNKVTFTFENGEQIILNGWNSTDGLANAINIL
jgi:Ca2+-binding RTX toxin-like protein